MAATTFEETPAERRDGVSLSRLLWVGPLTVVVALVVNLLIKTLLQALDPSLTEMGQLGRPLIILTVEGAILAVLALLLSLSPDLLLGLGGEARRTGSALVSPFTRFGAQFFPAPAGGGGSRRGLSPGEVLPGLPWERVLLLLLHAATAVVCIVLLTTLTREPGPRRLRVLGAGSI